MKKVAIQGFEGSYHDIATRLFFKDEDTELICCETFGEVFEAMAADSDVVALVAIENTIAGSLLHNYELLRESGVVIVGEQKLRIAHCICCLPDEDWADLHEVHSHPVALAQCEAFLQRHPELKAVQAEDTALSARHVAEQGLRHSAAIASSLAAEMFGLKIIAPAINTVKNNYTRFMILKLYDHRYPQDANKASLYFKTDHRQGSLLRALQTMDRVNMSKLQSYPIASEPWRYMFHVDMEFDCFDDYIRTLDALQNVTSEIHVYGVYRKAENRY